MEMYCLWRNYRPSDLGEPIWATIRTGSLKYGNNERFVEIHRVDLTRSEPGVLYATYSAFLLS